MRRQPDAIDWSEVRERLDTSVVALHERVRSTVSRATLEKGHSSTSRFPLISWAVLRGDVPGVGIHLSVQFRWAAGGVSRSLDLGQELGGPELATLYETVFALNAPITELVAEVEKVLSENVDQISRRLVAPARSG